MKLKNKKAQAFEPGEIIVATMLVIGATILMTLFIIMLRFGGTVNVADRLELEEKNIETSTSNNLLAMLTVEDSYGTTYSELIERSAENPNYQYLNTGKKVGVYTEELLKDWLDIVFGANYYFQADGPSGPLFSFGSVSIGTVTKQKAELPTKDKKKVKITLETW